jgi:hypothetical protein
VKAQNANNSQRSQSLDVQSFLGCGHFVWKIRIQRNLSESSIVQRKLSKNIKFNEIWTKLKISANQNQHFTWLSPQKSEARMARQFRQWLDQSARINLYFCISLRLENSLQLSTTKILVFCPLITFFCFPRKNVWLNSRMSPFGIRRIQSDNQTNNGWIRNE